MPSCLSTSAGSPSIMAACRRSVAAWTSARAPALVTGCGMHAGGRHARNRADFCNHFPSPAPPSDCHVSLPCRSAAGFLQICGLAIIFTPHKRAAASPSAAGHRRRGCAPRGCRCCCRIMHRSLKRWLRFARRWPRFGRPRLRWQPQPAASRRCAGEGRPRRPHLSRPRTAAVSSFATSWRGPRAAG